MAPLYGRGSTASRQQPLRGGSLLFTTQFPEIPGTLKNIFNLMYLKTEAVKVLRYIHRLFRRKEL